jgi:hypothetical protein
MASAEQAKMFAFSAAGRRQPQPRWIETLVEVYTKMRTVWRVRLDSLDF